MRLSVRSGIGNYLQVLLAVERDRLGLHLAVLDVNLVAAEHVEHDDGALALDVVAVAQAAELLLARRVPHVECDRSPVGGEAQRVHLHAQSG